jgi:hypothetical protein
MDEEFFSITHCGRYAIFTKQINVHNEDLYKVSIEELFKKPTSINVASETSSDSKKKMTNEEGKKEIKKEEVRKSKQTMASL